MATLQEAVKMSQEFSRLYEDMKTLRQLVNENKDMSWETVYDAQWLWYEIEKQWAEWALKMHFEHNETEEDWTWCEDREDMFNEVCSDVRDALFW